MAAPVRRRKHTSSLKRQGCEPHIRKNWCDVARGPGGTEFGLDWLRCVWTLPLCLMSRDGECSAAAQGNGILGNGHHSILSHPFQPATTLNPHTLSYHITAYPSPAQPKPPHPTPNPTPCPAPSRSLPSNLTPPHPIPSHPHLTPTPISLSPPSHPHPTPNHPTVMPSSTTVIHNNHVFFISENEILVRNGPGGAG